MNVPEIIDGPKTVTCPRNLNRPVGGRSRSLNQRWRRLINLSTLGRRTGPLNSLRSIPRSPPRAGRTLSLLHTIARRARGVQRRNLRVSVTNLKTVGKNKDPPPPVHPPPATTAIRRHILSSPLSYSHRRSRHRPRRMFAWSAILR